jgi:hypothetical protein
MIKILPRYTIKTLDLISPSQYYSAINCPYKLVLANSFEYKPLLPSNANAHFGAISHKMIELISKGSIVDEQTFLESWAELINNKEIELKEKGLSSITPLKYFVTDFALKKNQIKNILQKRKEKSDNANKVKSNIFFSEKRLENSNRSIAGIVDLIIENDFGATILDFKTGKIYSKAIDESEFSDLVIKKEYEIQLKLYAHLYYIMNGKYPFALYLVTLSNDFIKITFKESECEKIYLEALDFLSKTNSDIVKNDLKAIARPSSENCKYCSYRPACTFYSTWISDNFETVKDLSGKIEKVDQFSNDTLGLQLITNGKLVLINGLPVDQKENFETLIGKNVIIYNLKKNKQSLNATANNFTVVYE